MAKSRMINTTFWSDSFIQNLNIADKLLFLYLLTNEHTDICGIYEISIKTMAFESGLPIDTLRKSIDRLSKVNKINFVDNWIFIKNFQKHQQCNPKVQRGIEIGIERVPKAIYDRLCIDYEGLSHSNPNSNPNSNSNSKSKYMGVLDFENFWNLYPNKKNKKKAMTIFLKLKKSLLPEILKALEAQKQSEDWLKDGGQYVPHPTTWLNGEQWKDEIKLKNIKKDPYANIPTL